MKKEELEALVDEVRAGRGEDAATEFKRSWWNFTVDESRKEFVRDVTALANANTKERRVIIVGLDSSGSLHDSPLPEDEAKLQQRLSAITPHPHVTFAEVRLADQDGSSKTCTVIEVLAPFDTPYVAKLDNANNAVYLRRGSSIGTASRGDLERFYKGRERHSQLSVSWVVHPEPHGSDSIEQDVLVAPLPAVTVAELKALVDTERDRAFQAKATATHPDYPKLLEKYLEDCADCLKHINDPFELGRWYGKEHWNRRRSISVLVRNDGTAPASNVRVHVQFPDSVRLFTGHPWGGSAPKLRVIPPVPPPIWAPPPPRSNTDRFGLPNIGLDSFGLSRLAMDPLMAATFSTHALSFVNRIQAPAPTVEIEYEARKNRLEIWAKALTHTFEVGRSERFDLLVLPNHHGSPEIHPDVEYFCTEMEGWEKTMLPIRVEASAPLATDVSEDDEAADVDNDG